MSRKTGCNFGYYSYPLVKEYEKLNKVKLTPDTNDDGKITIEDIIHLQIYLTKFEGIVLGKQN